MQLHKAPTLMRAIVSTCAGATSYGVSQNLLLGSNWFSMRVSMDCPNNANGEVHNLLYKVNL